MRTDAFHLARTEINTRLGDLPKIEKCRIYLNALAGRYIHKVQVDQYFKYAFYDKTLRGRNKYIAGKQKREFFAACNDPQARKVFDDKVLFAEQFKEFFGRDSMDMKNVSFEEFSEFACKHDKMFIKPVDGTYGLGVSIVDCGEGVDIRGLYDSLKDTGVIAEEVVVQHPEMAEFNDSSLNTLRVITFVHPDGTAEVIPGALIRLGRKGGIADNFHHGGAGAVVDEKSGLVITTGIDQAGRRWIRHPDSNKDIVGFQVPLWDVVCECVTKAALVNPKVRCVGWDVALTAEGKAVLIEGNSLPDPDLFQMALGTGKWDVYKKYMQEVKQ